jgi:hypothetical protein
MNGKLEIHQVVSEVERRMMEERAGRLSARREALDLYGWSRQSTVVGVLRTLRRIMLGALSVFDFPRIQPQEAPASSRQALRADGVDAMAARDI